MCEENFPLCYGERQMSGPDMSDGATYIKERKVITIKTN